MKNHSSSTPQVEVVEPLAELTPQFTRFLKKRQDSLITHFTDHLWVLDPPPCQNNISIGDGVFRSPKKTKWSRRHREHIKAAAVVGKREPQCDIKFEYITPDFDICTSVSDLDLVNIFSAEPVLPRHQSVRPHSANAAMQTKTTLKDEFMARRQKALRKSNTPLENKRLDDIYEKIKQLKRKGKARGKAKAAKTEKTMSVLMNAYEDSFDDFQNTVLCPNRRQKSPFKIEELPLVSLDSGGPPLFDIATFSITSLFVDDALETLEAERIGENNEVHQWLDSVRYVSQLLSEEQRGEKAKRKDIRKPKHRGRADATKRALNAINVEELFDKFKAFKPWQIDALYDKLGLKHYLDVLERNFITGEDIWVADEIFLDSIGMVYRPHRLVILDFVAKIKCIGERFLDRQMEEDKEMKLMELRVAEEIEHELKCIEMAAFNRKVNAYIRRITKFMRRALVVLRSTRKLQRVVRGYLHRRICKKKKTQRRVQTVVSAFSEFNSTFSELRRNIINPIRLKWILTIRRIIFQNAVKKTTEMLAALHAKEYAGVSKEIIDDDTKFAGVVYLLLKIQKQFVMKEYNQLKRMIGKVEAPESAKVYNDIAISQRPHNMKLRLIREARRKAAASTIQKFYKLYKIAKIRHEAMDIKGLKQKVLNYLSKMLFKVQMLWRRYKWKMRIWATVKIQKNVRTSIASKRYREMYNALRKIQFYMRHWIGKKLRRRYGKKAYGFDVVEVVPPRHKAAARTIQRAYKQYKERSSGLFKALLVVSPRHKAAARTIQRAYKQYKERSSGLFTIPFNAVHRSNPFNENNEIYFRELLDASEESSEKVSVAEVADQIDSKIESNSLNIDVERHSEEEESHFSIFTISEIDNHSCTSSQKQYQQLSENGSGSLVLENGRLDAFEQDDDVICSLSRDENNSFVESALQSSRIDDSEANIFSLSTSSAEQNPISAKEKDSSTSFDTQISKSIESHSYYSDGEYSSYTGSYSSDGSESESTPSSITSKRPSTSHHDQAVIDYVRLNKDKIKELKDASIHFDAAVKKAKATMQACGEYPTPEEVISLENCYKEINDADRAFLNSLALHETSAPAIIVDALKVFYDKNKILKDQLEDIFKRDREVDVNMHSSIEMENESLHLKDSHFVNHHDSLGEIASVQRSQRFDQAENETDDEYIADLHVSFDSAEGSLQQDDIDSTNKVLTSITEDVTTDFKVVEHDDDPRDDEYFIKDETFKVVERELYTPKIAPLELLEKPSFVGKLSPNSFYFNLALASSSTSLGAYDGIQEIGGDDVSVGSSYAGLDADGTVYIGDNVDNMISDYTEQEMLEDEVKLPIDSGVVVGPNAPDFALVSSEPIRVIEEEVVTSGPLYRPGMPAKFQRKVKKTYTEDPIYYEIPLGNSSPTRPSNTNSSVATIVPVASIVELQDEPVQSEWIVVDDGTSKFYFNKVTKECRTKI